MTDDDDTRMLIHYAQRLMLRTMQATKPDLRAVIDDGIHAGKVLEVRIAHGADGTASVRLMLGTGVDAWALDAGIFQPHYRPSSEQFS